MDGEEYKLSLKQKMLGIELYRRQAQKQTIAAIMTVLEGDEQIEDMMWFMEENPQATEEKLIAVAYQLAKEANDND